MVQPSGQQARTLNAGDPSAWRCAVPDWKKRLMGGESILPALPCLDQKLGRQAVNVFNKLKLPDVVGQPTLGQADGPLLRGIVERLAGSLVPELEGRRGVNSVFAMIPKKNNKTTGGAGVMLTFTALNNRPDAVFGLFGPTQKIAESAFEAAAGMIEADDGLKKLFHVREHRNEIVYRDTGATLSITTFDKSVATGRKFAGWLLDEAHLLGRTADASRIVKQLRGARVAIHEAFGIIITTQSDEMPAGFFKEELDFARGVRDGTIERPGYLPLLFEFPDEIQLDETRPWENPDLWPLVNPNMGRSVSMAVLLEDYQTEKAKSDSAFRIWASQHLNIEIGKALHANRWPGAEHWAAAAEPDVVTLADLLARCECVTIGIDGGGLDDLLALTVIGRESETRRWISWSRAWIDKEQITKRKVIEAELRRFAADGDLRIVSVRDAEDVRELGDIVEQVHLSGLLPEKFGIGLDPVGVAAIMDEIVARGVPSELLAPVPQGYRLSGEIKGAARKLMDGSLVHADQPLMTWCVGNAAQEQKGNADLITKEVAGKSKIDPLMALFNAHALMARNPEASSRGRSYLDEDELMVA
jgi:phage terminase large subunit-like protein